MTDVDSGSRTAGPGPEPSPAGVRLDDAAVVRAWTRGAATALRRERAAIDRVNVFPVADADTGTNLYLTLREGLRAVEAAPGDTAGPRLLAVLARAALLGARGNSGVILSEWLRGLAVAARHGGTAADLLTRAATSARSAVERPAEGTILTAADAAAAAARAAEAGPDAAGPDGRVVAAAAAAARTAARASREELDVLRTAGVLDAGALGLVLVLDALVAAVADGSGAGSAGSPPGGVSVVGGSMDPVNLDQLLDGAAPPDLSPDDVPDAGASHGTGPGALELMFVLAGPGGDAAEPVAAGLRAALAAVGDSVVVVGGDTGTGAAVWQGHVHTDRLDEALAVAAEAARSGSLSQVHVRHLEAVGRHEWGVVVATSAPAPAAELAHAGAVVLLTGGIGSVVEPLTTDDVGRAAASTGARRVLYLGPEAAAPGAPGAVVPGPADTAAAGTGSPSDVDEVVAVVTPSDVHAVVALAALGTVLPLGVPHADDPAEPVDAPGVVAEAFAGLAVTTARGAGAAEALRAAAGPGTTVVTALLDTDVPADLPGRLAAVLAERAPEAELVVLPTGRPGDEVHLGVEGEA
ncbi:hypothetical protein APR03_001667 [Promicromonospora thailandica]|uniref:DhaL domain-containing protein n=1 Tax=Promicromonospora thailandica TaxID=765201 RepID=A0A9X2JUT0_9MICO|nr:DAK2 domain-containing protein [Promicromonospora thailandica]MCP2264331.1 hypothetical protein [Promicromonospora thailandica]